MKNLVTIVIFSILFLHFQMTGYTDKIDSAIKRARTISGKIVRCSPDGKLSGTVDFKTAIKRYRPGTILELTPGFYNPNLGRKKNDAPDWYERHNMYLIEKNNLVIQGDGSGKFCNIRLVLIGKNNVVRNIWAYTLEGEHITIVDSKFHTLCLTNGGRKVEPVIYNCAFTHMTAYPNKSIMTIKNCTLVRQYAVRDNAQWSYTNYRGHHNGQIWLGGVEKKGILKFQNCVLYTVDHLFRHWHGHVANMSIVLENNIIFGGMGYGWFGKRVTSLTEVGKYCKLQLEGENLAKKPKFKAAPKNSTWQSNDGYLLAPGCPGKKLGCGIINISPKGIPTEKK